MLNSVVFDELGQYQDIFSESTFDKMIIEHESADLMCTRISIGAKGGIWVLGKRILGGQLFLCAINQCSTLNEVLEITDVLLMETQAVIL